MEVMNVEIWDSTGGKRHMVELPSDATLDRVMIVLMDRMSLPKTGPDGAPMSYKFHHKPTGRQLLESQTLASAGVNEGDILRIVPEITAGKA